MKYLLLFTLIFSAQADEYLISEMENLRNSLDRNDPDRTELSLRLADLYFDVSIQEGEAKNIYPHRQKAANLYKAVLHGEDGIQVPDDKKLVKIRFQLARVLGKLNEIKDAKKYYHKVFEDKLATKKFKRESALALAEFYEEDANFNKSNQFYLEGVNLCESVETCNYAHYKRAWLLYKEIRLDEAISELKKSLWDSKNQARDKVINDLLLFVSASVTDGHKELKFFKELSQKTNQPDLVRKLVESFYGAGNRIAGSNVLVEWNEQNPSLFYELRLLEEFYGFRNWDKVRDYLTRVEKRSSLDISSDKDEAKEINAMLKRVIVQLDSETQQDKTYNSELLRIVDIYLSFYQNDDMRVKLQQGWLNAQSDIDKKIAKLKVWIAEDINFKLESQHIRKLRQSRLAMAQEKKYSDIVLEESLAISKIVDEKQAREFEYVYAHELYKNKEYDKALPVFIKLAQVSDVADNWSVKSQHLSLDIYNTKKDFAALVDQAKTWTTNPILVKDSKLSKDLAEMNKVQIQAEFEHTASLGESKEALDRFFNYCFKKTFEKKSCANAKILSVKLKDQIKLVSLLEREKDEKSLMNEYELMGRFSDAAKLNEKFNLVKNAHYDVYFKIALLYELDQNFKQRDRILYKLISKILRDKKIDSKWENALYLTLKEAKLINTKTLAMAWSLDKKLLIANTLAGKSTIKPNHKILIKSKSYTGPYWAKYILNKAQKLQDKQSKISFYGSRSESKFKRRNRAIEKMQKYILTYLEGADVQTRIYLLDILKKSYASFALEIMNTPLPEGLDEQMLAQINEQLAQMSSPYQLAAGNYDNLQKEQFATLQPEKLSLYQGQLTQVKPNYADLIEVKPIAQELSIADVDFSEFNTHKDQLNKDPSSVSVLGAMENFYKDKGLDRIASYFTGRINNLREIQ